MVPWLLLLLLLTTERLAASEVVTYTYTGGVCTSPCAKQGQQFYWCYKLGGDLSLWDYCSPASQMDYTGSYCSHDCVEGLLYGHWCSLEKGGWSLCSLVVGC